MLFDFLHNVSSNPTISSSDNSHLTTKTAIPVEKRNEINGPMGEQGKEMDWSMTENGMLESTVDCEARVTLRWGGSIVHIRVIRRLGDGSQISLD